MQISAKLLPLFAFFTLSSLTACGNDEGLAGPQEKTAVEALPTSTLSSSCSEKPLPESKATAYCRTLANGKVYSITLKPSTYIQDPVTCELSSPDDGMRSSLIEMGFTDCNAPAQVPTLATAS
ncbi:MAG: hypothetical protein H7249_05395 [Chitinophagaceae bacterium]|nr:hypothetical protein [Oligoflexus sp.]